MTTCKDCRHWNPDIVGGRHDATWAACQRNAPTRGEGRMNGTFPHTFGRDWCGEFKAKEVVPPDPREVLTMGNDKRKHHVDGSCWCKPEVVGPHCWKHNVTEAP